MNRGTRILLVEDDRWIARLVKLSSSTSVFT